MSRKDYEPRVSSGSSVGGGVYLGDWQTVSPDFGRQAKEWLGRKFQRVFSTALVCAMIVPSTMGAFQGMLRQFEIPSQPARPPTEKIKAQMDIPTSPQLTDIRKEAAQGAELQQILDQAPNPNLPAVNFSIIPKELCPHPAEEHINMAINFGDTKIDNFGKGVKYGEGIKEAISRKQEVTLVIEQPPRDKPQTPEQWRNYIRQIVQFYQPNEKTTFIVGNEINVPDSHGSYMTPNEYVIMYQTAYEEVKKASPKAKVFLYGEAYYGQGKYLSVILWQLRGRKVPFDGIAIHFYDQAEKLLPRLALYQGILGRYNFPGKPIIVSELGVAENLGLEPNDKQYSSIMAKLLAYAALAVQQGLIEEADWFTAASFSRQDHSLFAFDQAKVGRLAPTESLFPWLLTTRLLHHQVSQTESRGLMIFKGETAGGNQGQIVWGKSWWRTTYEVPEGKVAYDLQGNRLDSPQNRQIYITSSPVFFF